MRGHVRAKARGVYEVIVALPPDPITGRRRQMSRTVRGTKRDAEELRARLVVQVTDGEHATAEITVAELLARWVQHASDGWSPGNVTQTCSRIALYINPRIGKLELRRLKPLHIDGLYRDLMTSGGKNGKRLAPGTVRRVHTTLHRALQQAVRWQLIVRNPADLADVPRVPNSGFDVPSPADVGRLVEAADPEFRVFLHLAAALGARRGELCGLRWSDITDDSVTVRRTIVLADELVERAVLKNGRPRAAVALAPSTLSLLQAHRVEMAQRALSVGAGLAPDAFVFSSDAACRAPWRPDVVSHRFARLRETVGLPSVRLHDLRHWAATHMLDGGVTPAIAASRLGHARTSTTLDLYAHAVKASDRQAAQVLADLLAKES